jgi:hypothetical protein
VIPIYVLIGNPNAIEGFRDPTSDDPDRLRFRQAPGERTTQIAFPAEMGLIDAFNSVVVSMGHQMATGSVPAWIETDVPELELLLLRHWNMSATKNKRPRTWGEEIEEVKVKTGTVASGVTTTGLLVMMAQAALLFSATRFQLRTNAGRDWMARVMGDPASTGTGAYASATYIGVTANATAPAAGNTALAGEIVVGSLVRAQAVYSHTNGTTPYTLTKPFVSDQSITLAKLGVYTAITGGTLAFEALLNAVATMEPGDTTNITETVTLN